jgi:type IV pilus assembly protein PilE
MLRTIRGRAGAAGFTLIELMIVVVIMAILAAIVVPTYTSFVQRSKIIEGTARLGDFRTQMERYFMDNRTYLNGAACGIPDPPVAGSDNFQITCVAAGGPPETYTVTATGVGARGMGGFAYRINQANAKSSAGPSGKYTNGTCWALYSDGSC